LSLFLDFFRSLPASIFERHARFEKHGSRLTYTTLRASIPSAFFELP
jgi:hypothetical protein